MIEKKKNKFEDMDQYNHIAEIQAILKVIYMVPMDEEIKTIMRMRLWGMSPRIFYPLSHEAISELTKMSVDEVKAVEESGKLNCQRYLLERSTEDAVNLFNENYSKNKKNMFATMPYEKIRFSV